MIRERLAAAVRAAVDTVAADPKSLGLPVEPFDASAAAIEMERPQRTEHGDWATNVALQLAKPARAKPRDLATAVVAALGSPPGVEAIEIAGPGFINFKLSLAAITDTVREVEEAGPDWGRLTVAKPERIQVEFVSANPTGPLHVGHGRWAALGDALASVLAAAGHEVEREFYINDFGRQMDLFGSSLRARYLQQLGREADVPEGGYQGVYVTDLATELVGREGEAYLDAEVSVFRAIGEERMLAHQRDILERFGVHFDVWFSETSLHASGRVLMAIERLKDAGHVFEEDGALWLRTTEFGDDKDRVIVRADGTTTYFAPDVAYYLDKRSRGFDRLIYIIGADHHGYTARMRAMIRALGEDPAATELIVGQLVKLYRGGEPVRMSKRTGELITFEELIDEVGVDAARYTFLRHSADTPIEFDLEAVVRQSQDNPVFYVQYAHARIASILRYAEEQGSLMAPEADLSPLTHASELTLIRKIAELPETVEAAARLRSPHPLPRYAEDLAGIFHAFYRDCRVVTEDAALTQARLHLVTAARIALANVLRLLGVSAPEKMERTPEDEEPGDAP